MATSVISNTITDPAGVAVASARVVARLVPAPCFRITEGSEIHPEVETTTDANGLWSLTLERQANITPTDSHYVVTEYHPDGPHTFTIQVGAANASLKASLVTPVPAADGNTYLTQASADARYSPLGGLSFGSPVDVDTTSTDGVGTTAARADHRHKLAAAIAGNGLSLSAGALAVGVDGSSLEISADALRVKAAGITPTMMAATAWSTYVPTLTQSGAVTKTVTKANYLQLGKLVIVRVKLTITGAEATGNNPIIVGLPVSAEATTPEEIGFGRVLDAGTSNYWSIVYLASVSTVQFFRVDTASSNPVGQDPNFALANTDTIAFTATYEAA